MPKNQTILFYVVMVCLLLPIGSFAFLGARNARPNFVSSWRTNAGKRHVVIGYNNTGLRFSQFYCTDLETGATSTRVFEPMLRTIRVNQIGTKAWLFGEKTKDHFVLQMADLENDTAIESREFAPENRSELDYGIVVVDMHVIRFRSGTLESTDFSSGSIVDQVTLPIDEQSYVEHVPNTKNVLLVGPANPTSKVRDVFLFDVIDGQTRQLASWGDLHHLNNRIGDTCYVTSLLADGTTIEVRETRTGEIVSKYLVPQDPLLPTPMALLDITGFRDCCLQWRSVPTLHTDVLTGQTLPIPLGSELLDQEIVGNRLITVRKKSQESLGWDCISLDKSSGKELNRFDVAKENYVSNTALGGVFLEGANRLVLTTRDHRIFVYDLITGKLVREFDPFFWSDWCLRCAIVAYGQWCLVWLFVSAKCHPHGWIDLAVCSGLVVTYYANLYYTDPSVCLGVFASWLLVSISWLIFGKTRWSLRFQPLLLLVGVTTGIMNVLSAELDPRALALFVSGLIPLMLIYLLALMPLRWNRFRLEPDMGTGPNSVSDRMTQGNPKDQSQSIALRDLFWMTIVFALLFSILRWIPAPSWNRIGMREWQFLGILAGWIAGAGLFAIWVALSQSSWKRRWGVALLVTIGFGTLAPGVLGNSLPTFLTTLFGFYAYRLRGWRISRSGGMRQASHFDG